MLTVSDFLKIFHRFNNLYPEKKTLLRYRVFLWISDVIIFFNLQISFALSRQNVTGGFHVLMLMNILTFC